MKPIFKLLIPNKKSLLIFSTLSIIMWLAILQMDSFNQEFKFRTLHSLLWFLPENSFSFWMWFSAPVLFFTDGITPQSTISAFRIDSWEITYGFNFLYFYIVSSFLAHVLNYSKKGGKQIIK